MPEAGRQHRSAAVQELIEDTQRVREQTRLLLARTQDTLRKISASHDALCDSDALRLFNAAQRPEWPGAE